MSWIENPGVDYFNGFNISQLHLDQAWLSIVSSVSSVNLSLYELSSNCHKCPFQKIEPVDENKYIINTKFPVKYRLRISGDDTYVKDSQSDIKKFCDIEHTFGEFGVYNVVVNGTQQNPQCRVETTLEPVNIYYPLLLAVIFYIILGILIFVISKSHAKIKSVLQSSNSSKSSSSTTIERHSGEEAPQQNGHGHGNGSVSGSVTRVAKRSSSSAGTQTYMSSASDNGFSNVTGHGPQQRSVPQTGNENYGQSYCGVPGQTTEISISTISSTPTSTTVTTFGNVPHNGESPSNTSSVSRMPINHSVSNGSTVTNFNQTQSHPSTNTSRQQRQRLRSLDTFRGMCIVIMIFVNDGGAGYYWLEHATWDGLYIADLVFPWFLWIMGVCIPVSIKSQVKRGNSRFTIFRRIVSRSCKLIAIGVILGSLWGPVDIHTMRLPGVLQRFGICYFFCSSLVLFCMTVNITKPEASKLRAALQDVQIIWIAWIIVLVIILVHCMLTFFLEVPGCPTGYLGPGGLHDFYYEPYRKIASHCVGGAAGYIDQEVLQSRHLYQWPTAKQTYGSDAFDPEGILGILTSIFQVWLGVQTGVTMLVYPRASSRLKRWAAWSAVTGATGALLCGCKQTGGWIPLNKNLWSLSFVLVTNCFALVLLSALYYAIDIKRWWSGSPFFEPGMNSILLYVGHSVAHNMLPWHYKWGPMRTHFSRLIENLWGTSLWVLISNYLYIKKRFWTI